MAPKRALAGARWLGLLILPGPINTACVVTVSPTGWLQGRGRILDRGAQPGSCQQGKQRRLQLGSAVVTRKQQASELNLVESRLVT